MRIKISRKSSFLLYLIFSIIFLYAYQDYLTSTNIGITNADRGMVHLSLFLLILLLGLNYIYKIFSVGISKDGIVFSLYLITIWIGLVGFIQQSNIWAVSVHIGLSLLWILIYNFFGNYIKRFPNSLGRINICIGFLFLFYVYTAFYANYIISTVYERIAVVNLAYYVAMFLPWILLMGNKWIKRIFVSLVFLVILISAKRGAIIILPIIVFVYTIVEARINNKVIGPLIKSVFVIFLFIFSLIIVDNYTGGIISQRFELETLSEGSGRTDIYKFAINEFSQRSFIDMLIGYGSGSSVKYLGTGVHNEWLEFMFSFGIVGVILYLNFITNIFLKGIRLIKAKSVYAPHVWMLLVYILVVGMFDGIYFVHSTLFGMALLGAIEGLERNRKQ